MTPTPGQIAYETYRAVILPPPSPPFILLSSLEQAAWEATAQAVLDTWQARPRLEHAP